MCRANMLAIGDLFDLFDFKKTLKQEGYFLKVVRDTRITGVLECQTLRPSPQIRLRALVSVPHHSFRAFLTIPPFVEFPGDCGTAASQRVRSCDEFAFGINCDWPRLSCSIPWCSVTINYLGRRVKPLSVACSTTQREMPRCEIIEIAGFLICDVLLPANARSGKRNGLAAMKA